MTNKEIIRFVQDRNDARSILIDAYDRKPFRWWYYLPFTKRHWDARRTLLNARIYLNYQNMKLLGMERPDDLLRKSADKYWV